MLLGCSFFSTAQSDNLSFEPSKPKPGDKIRFEYSTKGTVLGGMQDIEAIAYIAEGNVRAKEIKLSAVGDLWTGEVETSDSTKVIFLFFKKNDELFDNNRDQGYSLLMYKDGVPVKGAYSALADVNSGIGAYLMRLNSEPAHNIVLFEKEFARNPDLKEYYMISYANMLMKADIDHAKDKIEPIIKTVLSKEAKTENDYTNAMWAFNSLKNKQAFDSIKKIVIQKYPKGMNARNEKLNAVYGEKALKKKEELVDEFIKTFPPKTENDKKSIGYLYGELAVAAANNDDWESFNKYIEKVSDKSSLAGTFNNLAWGLSGESIEKEGRNLKKAKEISYQSLQIMEKELENPTNPNPIYTDRQNKNNLKYSYGMHMDTYALILWKLDEKETAYTYQEKAVKLMNNTDVEANERYIIFKSEVKGSEAVMSEIEELIRNGKSSPALKDIYKKNFIAKGKSEMQYDQFMEELAREAREKLREELIKKILNDPAPKFAVKDLAGNNVSLDELKGKVVVLDFWAIWCGPCRASFPGMQKAVDKYKDDPDVKFLFVDSWENKKPEEQAKDAEEFIKKNKYSFNVLLDNDNKVIQSYGVEGIPTKFIVDKEGKIRFKSVGYSGSIDKLLDEMAIMIETAKNRNAESGKKAF